MITHEIIGDDIQAVVVSLGAGGEGFILAPGALGGLIGGGR
jgi:hypothetical protein